MKFEFEEYKRRMLEANKHMPITITDEELYKMFLSHAVLSEYRRDIEVEEMKKQRYSDKS